MLLPHSKYSGSKQITSSNLVHFDSLCQMFSWQMLMIGVLDVLIFPII